jgi:hypothetical protein
MDYTKIETMTKVILTCTVQFCLFSYKLCACHMTGCHFIHFVVLHLQLLLKRDFRLPPQSI